MLLATGAMELFVWRETLDPAPPEPGPLVLTLTLAAISTAALRRDNPGLGAAMLGALLAAAATSAIPVAVGLTVVVVIAILTWSGVARLDWSQFVGVAVLFAGTCWYLLQVSPDNAQSGIVIVLLTATASFATAHLRSVAAARASQAEQLAQERRTASLHAVQAQRVSVARELHDLVSNAVVVMTVQAGAAEALLPSDPQSSRRGVDHLLETGRATLAEVDHMFAALGDDAPAVSSNQHPQPGSQHDLQALVERMRAGGLDVELVSDSVLPPCPVTFRVVQESLTNALRHAPGSHVRMTVSTTATVINVDILDDGPGRSGPPTRGYGLVGISERVERIGGRVEAGPGPGGRGFHVVARIPVQHAGASP